jgi:hypothetical protein
VKPRRDARRLLGWYPPRWRSRYEEEFLEFLTDRYGTSRLPWSAQLSIVVGGLRECGHESGIIGTRSTAATQRKSGALMVLVAWSIMVVGGAVLQKTSEHYASSLPPHSHFWANLAFNVTVVSGIVGSLLVLAGAGVAIPSFSRLLRVERWSSLRRTIVPPLIATATLIAAAVGLSLWAHHLTSVQRNGSNDWYSAAFVVCVFLFVVTIGLWTKVAIDIANRCAFTPQELRRESYLALAVCLAALFVIAGAIVWWIQMAQHASSFFSGGAAGLSSSPWSTNLGAALTFMSFGTVAALWGATRVVLSFRANRSLASQDPRS